MNIFFVLSLNIGLFSFIASKINENGLPAEVDDILLVFLAAVTAIFNFYYIVANVIKKAERKGPISGTFIPSRDMDDANAARR